jgi:hypothetical protein
LAFRERLRLGLRQSSAAFNAVVQFPIHFATIKEFSGFWRTLQNDWLYISSKGCAMNDVKRILISVDLVLVRVFESDG